jgi:hypothetical protein
MAAFHLATPLTTRMRSRQASLASKPLDELLALALDEMFSIPWIAIPRPGTSPPSARRLPTTRRPS